MTANFGGGAPGGADADDSIESLLGAYALDAVSEEERREVEALLERSPMALAELATMQVAVDAMAAEAASAPPIGTWDRLRDRLAESGSDTEGLGAAPPADVLFPEGALSGRQRLPGHDIADGDAPGAAHEAADVVDVPPADGHETDREVTPVDELGRRRARRAGSTARDGSAGSVSRFGGVRGWPLAAAAAVVAVLMLGGLVVRQGTRIDNLSTEMASGGIERSAQEALADPSSELVDLAGSDLGVNVRAAVTADGTGYLFAEDLPELPKNQTYQLWAARDDNVVSVGVLGHRPKVSAFQTATDAKALAISVETAGGVVTSDHDPVAVGEFS